MEGDNIPNTKFQICVRRPVESPGLCLLSLCTGSRIIEGINDHLHGDHEYS